MIRANTHAICRYQLLPIDQELLVRLFLTGSLRRHSLSPRDLKKSLFLSLDLDAALYPCGQAKIALVLSQTFEYETLRFAVNLSAPHALQWLHHLQQTASRLPQTAQCQQHSLGTTRKLRFRPGIFSPCFNPILDICVNPSPLRRRGSDCQ